MTGSDLRARRRALGMTQTDLALALGVTRVTVTRWETDAETSTPIPAMLDLALQRLEETSRPMPETRLDGCESWRVRIPRDGWEETLFRDYLARIVRGWGGMSVALAEHADGGVFPFTAIEDPAQRHQRVPVTLRGGLDALFGPELRGTIWLADTGYGAGAQRLQAVWRIEPGGANITGGMQANTGDYPPVASWLSEAVVD